MSTKRICDVCQKDAIASINFDGNSIDVCKTCQQATVEFFAGLTQMAAENKVKPIKNDLPRKLNS